MKIVIKYIKLPVIFDLGGYAENALKNGGIICSRK
jgi:hypothetical protein